ncbi:MAG: multicopper oxidase domain-containing protein [Anaerolineales bacterium]|nr:multicopper oxidase domain-containing protein [Anaerolineales bacterium]MCB8962330.1 multicopper oxidase domain-containing protein [Ardenticatenales bacterium]
MMAIQFSRTRWQKYLLLALALILVVMMLVQKARYQRADAQATTLQCTSGPTFNLTATDGHITMPDGNSIYMWGFADDDGSGEFQMPGPTLCVNEGDTVTVNLTNDLAEPVSVVFPGQANVAAALVSGAGNNGLFTLEANPGDTVSYSFTAAMPGTYLYESGSAPHKQVQMGLYGGLIVRPALGATYAYNDPTTAFNPNEEYLLLLHEIDPFLHQAVERGEAYEISQYHPHYWTINGRAFPDAIYDNNVPWLPYQPYGSLVTVEAHAADSGQLPALVRYASASVTNHPFHPHGNHQRMIARDGRLLQGPLGEDIAMEDFTTDVGSGQTFDMLVEWVDIEAWDPVTNRIPAEIPGDYNLVIKDDQALYSNSPYLGEKNDLRIPSIVDFNVCGEYYFPWHSHALDEVQNFDEGFGGMLTLWRIDPPGGCQ